jgi:hypothetical protein
MTSTRIVTFLILFLATFSSLSAQEKSKLVQVDNFKVEINAFLDEWNMAIAKGDAATIRSAYITDSRFQWFEDGALTYRSANEIADRLSQFPKGTTIDTKLSNIDVRLLTDKLAYGSASYATKLTMPNGPFEFRGVFTMLLERDNGRWKFVFGHTSTVPSRR